MNVAVETFLAKGLTNLLTCRVNLGVSRKKSRCFLRQPWKDCVCVSLPVFPLRCLHYSTLPAVGCFYHVLCAWAFPVSLLFDLRKTAK